MSVFTLPLVSLIALFAIGIIVLELLKKNLNKSNHFNLSKTIFLKHPIIKNENQAIQKLNELEAANAMANKKLELMQKRLIELEQRKTI